MKKIYSFVLMAVALLIGTNAWAQNTVRLVNHTHSAKSGDYASLQAAVNAVEDGDTATITLLADQKLTAAVVIPLVGDTANWNSDDPEVQKGEKPIRERLGQRICLNLNGKLIQQDPTATKAKGCFHLAKGKLDITGQGEIQHNIAGGDSNPDKSVITVWGAPWAYKTTEWSTLIIGEQVFINSNGAGKNYGICIQNESGSPANIVNKLGYHTYYGTNPKNANITSCQSTGSAGCAYGVMIFIKGKVFGNHRGINSLGTINAAPECDENWTGKGRRYPNPAVAGHYYNHLYPYVKIYNGAEVWCRDNGLASGNGGIYAGGYAVWDVSGNVHGQTGIFMKAGDFQLKDATVASDSQEAESNANYGENVSGSGIFISSDKSYVGEVDVVISGETTVTGGGEAAIVDALASNSKDETHVSSISIEGGTIEPGNNGAFVLTDYTGNDKTVISGGNVQGEIVVDGATKPVAELVDTTTHHVTVIVDESGNKTYAVSEGDKPTGSANVAGHAAADLVKWTNTEETLYDNLTIAELEINEMEGTDPKAQVLTIGDDTHEVTLKVGRVVLGTAAKIIVNPGSKLIVTGEDGIVSLKKENLVLKTSEAKQAIFLIEPTVQNNRYPMAQVELKSKGYKKDGKYIFQRFGVPSYTDYLTRGNLVYDPAYPTGVYKYDYAKNKWASMADADKFVPFRCYELTTTATTPGAVYTFECPLVGNDNGTLRLEGKWSYFANSYSAPIDIAQIRGEVDENYKHVSATIYLYRASDNWWYEINEANWDEEGIPTQVNPMQAFIFQRMNDGENIVVNYKKQVYDPIVTPSAGAPARSRQMFNKAIIEIAAADGTKDMVRLVEGEQFSAEFDNGYDAVKYMNDAPVQVYADAEADPMAIVASDNLEGTTLSMTTKEQTSFTMTINYANGMNYAVRDMLTGTEIEMVAGATYMFSVPANATIEGRFQIVGRNNAPTAIENVEETAAVKGIYTITGQFVGNDYHSLPAGIYVVDGKKIVK